MKKKGKKKKLICVTVFKIIMKKEETRCTKGFVERKTRVYREP